MLPVPTIDSLLPLLSQVTLVMVVFDIGMSMKAREVVSQGRSAILRSALYMGLSIYLIAITFTLVFHWDLYHALFLGSIAGGEVSMVVVPYLAKRISRTDLISNLALESVFDSLVLIVLFFVLLNGYVQNVPLNLQGLPLISVSFLAQLLIGSVGGVLFGLAWLRIGKFVGNSDYFYLATVGYVLLAFVFVNGIGGSGVIGVLAVGLMMKNTAGLPPWLGLSDSLPATSLNYVSAFQAEISFFLRTFFLFFLGFSVPRTTLTSPEAYVLALGVIGILVVARLLSTELVDRNKGQRDRRFIETMMAQGLTPALLATTLIANSVVGADQILPIAMLVIVMTNVISAAGARLVLGAEERTGLESLLSMAPLVTELSAMTAGLGPGELEEWLRTIEGDAKKAAPPGIRDKIGLPRIPQGANADLVRELQVSRSAVPFIIGAIEGKKDSMPQGTKVCFEALEGALAKELRSGDGA